MGNTVTIITSSVITLIRGVSISPPSHTRSNEMGPGSFTSSAFYSSNREYTSSKSMILNNQKYDYGSAGEAEEDSRAR